MAVFKKNILRSIKEMIVTPPLLGLRNAIQSFAGIFYQAPTQPAIYGSAINSDQARALYYNLDVERTHGAFFAKSIVDGTADFIGVPELSVQDLAIDKLLNEHISKHWKKQLWEMYRQSLRDSKTWVRLRQPIPDVLMGPGEENIVVMEVIDADRVTPYYNPNTGNLQRVEISTMVYIEDEPFDPYQIYATGVMTHGRQHEIIEIIDKDAYRYFDHTNQMMLDEYEVKNDWGFIAMVEVFNDFDSALNGGSSELETVWPLFKAFHDVFVQSQGSYKYHANPKVKLKLKDVATFIHNNFPEAFVNGRFTGKIGRWDSRDLFLLDTDDDMTFVETTGNAEGSAVTLLEMIIDCMCIGAEVTEAILFRIKNEGNTSSEEFFRFKKKIERKRDNYSSYIQTLTRMTLKILKNAPQLPTVTWPDLQIEDFAARANALNQLVSAVEVANRSEVLSRRTYRAAIRQFFPTMLDDNAEEAQIQKEKHATNNLQIALDKKTQAALPKPTPPPTVSSINSPTPPSTSNGHQQGALPMDVTKVGD